MIDRRTVVAAATGALLTLAATVGLQAAGTPAPRAYVIGEVDVNDAETYKGYAARTPALIAQYKGAYLARGGQTVPLEGAKPASRVVIMEFPTLAAAKAFEDSPEYREVARIRQKSATSRLFIVEGLPPSP